MDRPRRNQRGFTLVELLVASSLMIVVLSATLAAFDGFLQNNRRNNELTDLQDNVRVQMSRITRQMRNLANPTSGSVNTINYADNYKFVFQTTDPTKRWVSYCLNTATRIIYYQASVASKTTIAPQLGGDARCPSTTVSGPSATADWMPAVQVGPNVTNGAGRPMFSYASDTGALPLPADGAFDSGTETSQITRVTVNLYVDNNTAKPPAEVNLQSGAFMRNQNQAPTSKFNVFKNGTVFTLDASKSDDPEQRTLAYYWYRESGTPSQMPGSQSGHTVQGDLPTCSDTDQTKTIGTTVWTCLGTGVVITTNLNGQSSPQNIWLMVVDPGNVATLSRWNSNGAVCNPFNNTPVLTDYCRSVTFP